MERRHRRMTYQVGIRVDVLIFAFFWGGFMFIDAVDRCDISHGRIFVPNQGGFRGAPGNEIRPSRSTEVGMKIDQAKGLLLPATRHGRTMCKPQRGGSALDRSTHPNQTSLNPAGSPPRELSPDIPPDIPPNQDSSPPPQWIGGHGFGPTLEQTHDPAPRGRVSVHLSR